ncbi:aspartic peptidase domain-containing protein [Amanita rubescens]|nr:aspartic peptidase domain-containing protein [Amanita rubescens]
MILSKLVVTLLTATVTFSARPRRKQSNSEDGFVSLGNNLTMDGILNYYPYIDDETFTMGSDIDPHTEEAFVSAPPIERRNQQPITINLQHYRTNRFEYDNVFVAEITLGFGTVFKVKVDTGSSDLWVASKFYKPPTGIQKMTLEIDKLQSESISQRKYVKMIYTSQVGIYRPNKLYEGEVIFGGVTVVGHKYGALAGFTKCFDDQPYDGILGLAFSALAFSQEKSVISETFKTGSKLFIGWLGDLALFDASRLEYHRVVKAGAVGLKKVALSYWAINNGKVKVGEEVIAENLWTLIVSGTDAIFGPQEQVDKIYAKIETAVKRNGHWILRCNLHPFPKISFSWGGQDWTLTRDRTIVNHGGTHSNQGPLNNEHVTPEGEWPSEGELRPKLGLAPHRIS